MVDDKSTGHEPDIANRMLEAGFLLEEDSTEISLRPRTLDEFVGQEKITRNLKVFIKAASARGEVLDHVLLHGPPGLGKTTMAGIIASEMGGNLRVTSGPAIERAGDLAAILTNLDTGDILFIDEIHRLPRVVEEILYSALEDFALDIMIGKGPSARSIRIDLSPFTLIGATTRFGQLSGPLRDRMSILMKMEMYSVEHLSAIVLRSAWVLGVRIDEAGAYQIASRSRGTPRIANRLLKRVRDFAQVEGDGAIDAQMARQSLDKMEVDELGLDSVDKKLLNAIIKVYNGGPVGLDTIAATAGEETITIEEVYEPYLLQIGFLNRTPRGRCVTRLAYEHLGVPFPTEVSALSEQISIDSFDGRSH